MTGLSGGWHLDPVTIDGIDSARWRKGTGVPLLLIHGVGPGTTGLANFAPLLETLASRFEVHLLDLIGFGASGKKREMPYFDVALWLAQLGAVLDGLSEKAVVFGNSVGGALALKLAAARPEAVERVLAVGAPCVRFVQPPAGRAFWSVPESPAALAAIMRPMTAAQVEPAPALVAQRFAVLEDPVNRAYFAGIVAGDGSAQLAQTELQPDEAAKISCPVMLVYGRQDRACPPQLILPLIALLLPAVDMLLLGACGHNATHERSADLLALACLQSRVTKA